MTDSVIRKVSGHHMSRRSVPRLSTGAAFSSQLIERRKRGSKMESVEIEPSISYPDEESMKQALEAALKTEMDFLEFAESLNLPQDNFLSPTSEEDSPSVILKQWRNESGHKIEAPNEPHKSCRDKVMVVRQNRSSHSQSPACNSSRGQKVGLDHLDNLVRLMEELSALREQNNKLRQRVTDFESKKVVKEKSVFVPCDQSLSSITSLSIQNSPEVAVKTLNKIAKIEQEKEAEGLSMKLKRHSKSGSTGKRNGGGKILQRSPRLEDEEDGRRESKPSIHLGHSFDNPSPKARGSAWTKVKDAFKREIQDYSPLSTRSNITEKSPSVDDILSSLDPNLMSDLSRFLPPISSSSSSSDEESNFCLYNPILDLENSVSIQRSSSFSQVSELLPPFSSSPSPFRRHSITSLAIDDDFGKPTKEEKKVPKTTWGKVKNMIYTRRDSLKKKDSSLSTSNQVYASHLNQSSGLNLESKKAVQENRKRAASLNAAKIDSSGDYELMDPSGIWMGPPDKRHPVDSPRLMPKHFPALTSLAAELKTKNQSSSRLIDDSVSSHQDVEDFSIIKPNSTIRPIESLNSDAGVCKKGTDVTNSPQIGRTSIIKTSDNQHTSWSNKVRKVWTSKREDDFSSNPVSTPTSPMQDSSTVFIYDEAQIITEEAKVFPPAKDSPESQSSGDWHQAQDEIQRNYELLQRRLSDEFNRKRQEWERDHPQNSRENNLQNIGRSRSAQSGPAELERHLSPEFRRKYNEWQKMKQDNQARTSSPPLNFLDNTKSQETPIIASEKKVRGRPLGEQIVQRETDLKPEFRLKVAEWEIRKALAGQGCKNIEEIRKLMPEDFNRKLQKWELIKDHVGTKGPSSQERKGSIPNNEQAKRTSTVKADEKRKSEKYPERMVIEIKKEADSLWIEQELKQLKREKQKLESDREKCLEKELRLEKIREALQRGVCHEKEITVKTSKGEEFKFCGISDTFTKKLFEWEESRGIGPESSTIALLNNPVTPVVQELMIPEPQAPKKEGGPLKKARSEGSLPESIFEEKLPLNNRSKRTSEGNISQTSPQSFSDQEILPICSKMLSELSSKELPPPPNTQEHHNHAWDYLLHIEHLLDKLQSQICQNNEDKMRFDSLVLDLRQTTHTAIKHQVSHHQLVSYLTHQKRENLSRSFSDLSCGELSTRYAMASDNDSHHSDASSSHSMSRYGSESPLYAIIMGNMKEQATNGEPNLLDEITDQHDQDKITEDKSAGNIKLAKPRSRRSSLSPDNTGKGFGFRMLAPKRRTSSENISTPNSGRSRSSSLLSSEYIPEEEDHPEVDEQDCQEVFSDVSFKAKFGDKSAIQKGPNSSSSRPLQSALSTDMDQLYQLVHDLKEKDLSYHKSLIAAKNEAARRAAEEQGLCRTSHRTGSTTSSSGDASLCQDISSSAATKITLQKDGSSSPPALSTSAPISTPDIEPSPIANAPQHQIQGDDNTEWEPDAISEEPVVKYEEGQLKSVIEPNVLEKGLEDAKLTNPAGVVEKQKLQQTKSLPASISHMTIGFSGFHIDPLPVRISLQDHSSIKTPESDESSWESISKERSKQLMKAREQFFYGELCPKVEFQRVIVTTKEVSNIEEPQIAELVQPQTSTEPSDDNTCDQVSHFLRLRKPNIITVPEGSPPMPGSVAFRRSLFEPKNGQGQKADSKKGLDVSHLTVSSLSCPSSPSMASRSKKKSPFSFESGDQP